LHVIGERRWAQSLSQSNVFIETSNGDVQNRQASQNRRARQPHDYL
jgi:hypothetical protein